MKFSKSCYYYIGHVEPGILKVPKISLHIYLKAWRMKFIFQLQINTEVFCKLIVSLWVCIARHTQSIQNNKFTISLQYLKETVRDEVDFLPADKRWRFLQIVARHAQITQNNKFAISLQYLQKEVSDGVFFFMQISIKACYKLWASKFPTAWYYYY